MDNSDFDARSAGGVIVNEATGQIALAQQISGAWSLPKGAVEAGEGIQAAAIREIQEETGVKEAKLVKYLGGFVRDYQNEKVNPPIVGWKRIDFFLFTAPHQPLQPTDPENPEAKWVSTEEALKLLFHPRDREFLQSVSENIRLFSGMKE